MKQEVGSLIHLYLEEIAISEPSDVSDFIINGAAQAIRDAGERNWIPVIVKQLDVEEYEAIANIHILAAADLAGLKKVWCVIADDSERTQKSAQILAQELTPQINLATATKEEIKAALIYLKGLPKSPLSGIQIDDATRKISNAPRQYWKENLIDVTKLKCRITRGRKLDTFKTVFFTTPSPLPDVITDLELLEIFTVGELKKMAKKRGFKGYSKFGRSKMLKLLSENEQP